MADDGAAFQVVQSNGSSLTLDAVPTAFATPGLLAVFGPSASVVEDYVLPGGSPAEGSGMTPPGGPIVDAGAWELEDCAAAELGRARTMSSSTSRLPSTERKR